MIFAKYIPWETLKSMKKILAAHLFVGTAGTGLFIYYDTLYIDKCKTLLECLDSGFPSPLKKEVQDVFAEVLNDMKLEEKEKEKLQPFKMAASKFFHAGYPRYGTIIGLPPNFEYESPYDVPRILMSWNQHVDLDSPIGMRHKEALILNKNEKKFAIVREIFESRSPNNYIFAALPISFSIMSFAFLHLVTTQLKKQIEHTPWRKKGFYLLFYLGTFILYFNTKDALTCNIEFDADTKVADIGLEDGKPTDLTFDYIKGGIGYYDKILTLNKITKENYMPKYLKWLLTDDGDRSQYFRNKHASYIARKDNLQQMLDNYDKHGLFHDSDIFWKNLRDSFEENEKEEEKAVSVGKQNVQLAGLTDLGSKREKSLIE